MDFYSSTKRPGNILSAFNSDYKEDFGDKFVKLKKQIVSQIGENQLQEAWDRLLKEFENEIELIKELGSQAVPQVAFDDIVRNGGKFPTNVELRIRNSGCVVIKEVIEINEALQYKEQVKKYIAAHPGQIAGFPEDRPQVWELYWSKVENKVKDDIAFIHFN